MRLLHRYVLAELLKVFVIALTALTLIMLLVGVVREARSHGLPPAQILQLIPYFVPEALRFTVPSTILLATCTVFGRMAGANEVVVIKSLGISPMAVLWPAFVLATVLSLMTVLLNDLAVSWGRNGARQVVIQAVEEVAYGMLRSQKSFQTDRLSISVKQVRDRVLIRPVLTFPAENETPGFTVSAEEAELRSEPGQATLTIVCRNGTIAFDNGVTVEFPDAIERQIPLEDASRSKSMADVPSWMPMHALHSEIREERQRIALYEQELAVLASLDMLTGDLRQLSSAEWNTRASTLEGMHNRLHRLQTEPYRRWANGFSCLCFVMMGAPMAIRLRNADLLTSFFACFLPILILYYPLLAVGVGMAKDGTLPPISVWLGNVLVALVGLWMLRHVIRY